MLRGLAHPLAQGQGHHLVQVGVEGVVVVVRVGEEVVVRVVVAVAPPLSVYRPSA